VQVLAMVLLMHVSKLASDPAFKVRNVADEVCHYLARLPPAIMPLDIFVAAPPAA